MRTQGLFLMKKPLKYDGLSTNKPSYQQIFEKNAKTLVQ